MIIMQKPKIVYAANRQIGVEVLKLLIKAELYPICLIVPKGKWPNLLMR